MVGIISIANALGRLLWAWLSDATGRRNVFLIMFLLQALTILAWIMLASGVLPLLVCGRRAVKAPARAS
jgi:OFA family oxalate/formate antiporter-like MFS transporter